jgi:hypothetical protein
MRFHLLLIRIHKLMQINIKIIKKIHKNIKTTIQVTERVYFLLQKITVQLIFKIYKKQAKNHKNNLNHYRS